MPKVVDAEQRRREIAHTVWQIIAEEGMAALTLRRIATRGQFSMGRVQHYFPSRESIVRYGLTAYLDAVSGSLPPDRPPAGGRGLDHLLRLLTGVVPRTELSRIGAKVWYAYLTEAVTDATLAEIVRAALQDAQNVVTDLLDGDRSTAISLLAAVDGLVYRVLVGALTADDADRLIHQNVRDRLKSD